MRWIYLTQAVQALLLDTPERRWMVYKCINSMAPGVGASEEVHAYFYSAVGVDRGRCECASLL